MSCPLCHIDTDFVLCGCDVDELTRRAQLQSNYWRWRARGSEWAVAAIPAEWRFLAVSA